jgi:hypothetical protein
MHLGDAGRVPETELGGEGMITQTSLIMTKLRDAIRDIHVIRG